MTELWGSLPLSGLSISVCGAPGPIRLSVCAAALHLRGPLIRNPERKKNLLKTSVNVIKIRRGRKATSFRTAAPLCCYRICCSAQFVTSRAHAGENKSTNTFCTNESKLEFLNISCKHCRAALCHCWKLFVTSAG